MQANPRLTLLGRRPDELVVVVVAAAAVAAAAVAAAAAVVVVVVFIVVVVVVVVVLPPARHMHIITLRYIKNCTQHGLQHVHLLDYVGRACWRKPGAREKQFRAR